ncbi:MAG: hypothetical protein QXX41_04860 [Nitrososphaerota archaeon]
MVELGSEGKKMGTTSFESLNRRTLDNVLVDWGRFFRLENIYEERYEKLYDELSNCKQKLQEMSLAYQKILTNTDFDSLKEIVRSLSPKQAVYYATLLEIYETKLDYVDIYSLAEKLDVNRRTVEKLLTGTIDTKPWRRGSPKIREICEKCYLKIKRGKARRIACFKPKGFFEFLSRLSQQISLTLSVLEKTTVEIVRKTKLDLRMAEAWLSLVEHIDKVTSEKEEIPIEFTNFSAFLSKIGKNEKELPQQELEKLKEAFNDFKKFGDLIKAIEEGKSIMREYFLQQVDVNKLKKSKLGAELTLENREKALKILRDLRKKYLNYASNSTFFYFWKTLNTEIFSQHFRLIDLVAEMVDGSLHFLDYSIFEFKLAKAKIFSLDEGVDYILKIKQELDEKLQYHFLDKETYRDRIKKLQEKAESMFREKTQSLEQKIKILLEAA